MAIERVGVVGAGTMGSGIIEVVARNGLPVVAHEVSPEAVEAGRSRVEGSMNKAVERGKLDEEVRDTALAATTWTTDLADLATTRRCCSPSRRRCSRRSHRWTGHWQGTQPFARLRQPPRYAAAGTSSPPTGRSRRYRPLPWKTRS